MKPIYTPRPDGLPAMVMAFFRNNPDEELGLDDISDKFDTTRGNIHTLLAEPMRLGYLARTKDADGEWIYKRGTELPAGAPPQAEKAKRTFVAPQEVPSIEAVVIEDNVPIPSTRGPRADWLPLLKKLQPGQSFCLPLKARHTMVLAITDAHKAEMGKYTTRTLKETNQLRVWRTA